MYCVIQEVGLKKASKGNSKRLEVYTWDWTINDKYIKKYTYRKSSECFDRPIKKAYKISIHESYRENGEVKKKQWHISTEEHYSLIEYGFELWKVENKLNEMGITEAELYEIIYKKLDTLIEKITEEYHKTDEYKAEVDQTAILNKYTDNKQTFEAKYGDRTYDICYDIFGMLRNKDELDRIKKEYEETQKQRKSYERAYENYRKSYSSSGYSVNNSSNYNENEKKLLKEAFKLLSHKHHPDKGGSTETMSIINNLKDKLLKF
ncbi:hypothetical protein [Metaclostridioides mangenotii]|uniref:J domain-containing protein n=1 Tax=Metaclostridioides mangenotii TaxID=1540 RepID=A0ABS4E7X3_9FIRM|nr:hypothetical protein [Clostridioides mangenotii]MBP1854034.1 hypothetical protein [Clostridioides mangenotii]